DDARLNLDIQGHRLDRVIHEQWKKCQAVTERWADEIPKRSQLVRGGTQKLWNNLAGRVPVQIWLRNAKSVLTHCQDRLMASYRELQGTARSREERSTLQVRAGGNNDRIVVGLTSAGTLRLRSRLEDEVVPQYEQ